MHSAHGFVDGVLTCAVLALQSVKRSLQIVNQWLVIQLFVILAVQLFQCLQLLNVAHTHVWSQIEVECRYSLSAVHLVLSALHRDTSQHAGSLYTLCGARCSVTGSKTVLQYVVERVLHTGKTLSWVVVLIVNVQVVMLHRVTTFLAQQIVVNKWLCCLAGKLHHHAGRCVGVHICVLAGNVVVLYINNVEEHLAGLCLTSYRALVAIGNVLLSHVFSARLHQLHLHQVLNLLHRHLSVALLSNTVGNLVEQSLVFTLVCMQHGLTYGGHHLLFVKSYYAPVALLNCLYHKGP